MFEFFEVLFSKAEHCSPIHLATAAHIVIGAGAKRRAFFVEPGFLGHILLARENGVNVPVFGLLRQVVSPLQNGHPQAVLHHAVGQSAATYATADDDYVGRRRHSGNLGAVSIASYSLTGEGDGSSPAVRKKVTTDAVQSPSGSPKAFSEILRFQIPFRSTLASETSRALWPRC